MSGVVPALAQDEEESEGRKKSLQSLLFEAELQAATLKAELDSLRQLTAGGNNGQSAGDGAPAASDAMVLPSDVEKLPGPGSRTAGPANLAGREETGCISSSPAGNGGRAAPDAIGLPKRFERGDVARGSDPKDPHIAAADCSRAAKSQSPLRLPDAVCPSRVALEGLAAVAGRTANEIGRIQQRRPWDGVSAGRYREVRCPLFARFGTDPSLADRTEAPDRITPIPRELAPLPRAPVPSQLLRNISLAVALCLAAPSRWPFSGRCACGAYPARANWSNRLEFRSSVKSHGCRPCLPGGRAGDQTGCPTSMPSLWRRSTRSVPACCFPNRSRMPR